MNPTAEKLMDAAERRIRAEGYNAFSFRDLANDTGIKSASVHYHFATKEALGAALVDRYTMRLKQALEEEIKDTLLPQEKLIQFVAHYRRALEIDQSICLCAMLGAEAIGLPETITRKVDAFFDLATDWLTAVFREADHAAPGKAAQHAVSALSGAMIVASVSRDKRPFETTAEFVESML